MGYLIFTTTKIVNFFASFAQSGKFTYSNALASEYINIIMYLVVLVIIGVFITIYLLMKSKQKQTKFYIFTIIYYISLFALLAICSGIMGTIQNEVVDTRSIRAYRDLSLLLYLPQYFYIFYTLFRALGFDLKKFNFSKDLNDMAIEAQDNEEVEIVVGDNYKLKRTFRRFIREFKYYFQENTFVFICLGIIGVIASIILIFNSSNVKIKTLKIGGQTTYKNFQMTYLNSMLTDRDYQGNILRDEKYYLVINFNVKNQGRGTSIDMKDFRLLLDETIIYPTFNYNEYFIDYGNPYQGETIARSSQKDILIIYELTKEQIMRTYKLRLVGSVLYNNSEVNASYIDVNIAPTIINKIDEKGTYVIGQELDFKGSLLKNSTLRINEYELTNLYKYTYDFCFANDCQKSYGSVGVDAGLINRKTLLVMNYNLNLEDTYFKNNIKHDRYIFLNFATIRYTIDGQTKTSQVTDKSATSLEKTVILQVDKELAEADKIELLITIRNIRYIITLK